MNLEELKKNNQIVEESQVVPSIVKMDYLVDSLVLKDLYQMEQAIVEDVIGKKKKLQDLKESLLKGNMRVNEDMKRLVVQEME